MIQSQTPEPISYEFPEGIIDNAKAITLADLLDCPATQCWVVSALGNAVAHHQTFLSEMQPKDSHLVLQVKQLQESLPGNERLELYKLTSELIRSRRQQAE